MQTLDALQNAQPFWDKIAPKYAQKPVANLEAYEQKLTRVRALLRSSDRVLELGCGTGSTALTLADGVAEMTATDISAEMIQIAEAKRAAAGASNVSFYRADATATPSGARYDVVSAYSLLHLVPNVPAVLEHAYFQLKPGGLFVSKTVCLGDANFALRLFVQALGVVGIAPPLSFLSKDQLIRAIVRAGFDVVESRYFDARKLNPFIIARRPA